MPHIYEATIWHVVIMLALGGVLLYIHRRDRRGLAILGSFILLVVLALELQLIPL